MPEIGTAHRWRGAATAFLLIAASCTQLPPTGSVAIPPISFGLARLWFYRDGGPRETQERPYLRLNGQIAGISEPNGVFYRDVAPGHYAVTVDSYLSTYVNQFADIDLGAGQEAFVKVLSQGQWVGRRGRRQRRRKLLHAGDPGRSRPRRYRQPPLLQRQLSARDRSLTD
jgi:hypothetical protein